MGEGPVVWLAVFGGVVAAACAVACACACAWLARAARSASQHAPHSAPHRGPATTIYVPQAPVQPVPVAPMPVAPPAHAVSAMYAQPIADLSQLAPTSMDRIPDHVVMDRHPAVPQRPAAPGYAAAQPRAPIVLEGHYPQLGAALGTWLQVEPDEVERIRIARDLGTVGGAGSARALLDGVRTGVLSPTIAADQLERGGFEAGITVAAALSDPEPRVRALASSLVGRTTPLQPARVTSSNLPPMPPPPSDPRA